MNEYMNLLIRNAAGDYFMQFRDGNAGIPEPLRWAFFGGGVEGDESATECAAREMEEELGIKTSPDDFRVIDMVEWDDIGARIFLVEYKHPIEWGDFILDEGAGCGFFTATELDGLHKTYDSHYWIRKNRRLFKDNND